MKIFLVFFLFSQFFLSLHYYQYLQTPHSNLIDLPNMNTCQKVLNKNHIHRPSFYLLQHALMPRLPPRFLPRRRPHRRMRADNILPPFSCPVCPLTSARRHHHYAHCPSCCTYCSHSTLSYWFAVVCVRFTRILVRNALFRVSYNSYCGIFISSPFLSAD